MDNLQTATQEGGNGLDTVLEMLRVTENVSSYSVTEMVVNLFIALTLGILISKTYHATHRGLSYSQSFSLTLVFMTIVVALIMMIIGSSLARAFALVGAMSIIRFRTVVKDTKDTAFVFTALAIGMAAGTGNYFLAFFGCSFVMMTAFVLDRINFGVTQKSEFVLQFSHEQGHDTKSYISAINSVSKKAKLLHIEPSGDEQVMSVTYGITLKKKRTAQQLVESIKSLLGVSNVTVIASNHELDF